MTEKKSLVLSALILSITSGCSTASHSLPSDRTLASALNEDESLQFLTEGWKLQTSEKIGHDGVSLSQGMSGDSVWLPIHFPSTVVAGLVENKILPDPNFGSNMKNLPGARVKADAKEDENISLYDTSPESPFAKSWWYYDNFKTGITSPEKHVFLHFDGINYSANIFLNGHQVASPDQITGSFRSYEFDISKYLKAGAENHLAVEVFGAVKSRVLSTTWVDWAPNPPDKNMGIFRDVYLTQSGDVKLEHSQVRSSVPDINRAFLTAETEIENLSDQPVQGTLQATLDKIVVKKAVKLRPLEKQIISFDAKTFPELSIQNPKLWWPRFMGTHPLNHALIEFTKDGETEISSREEFNYGIREITSSLDLNGSRLFKVNGHPIMIRGGGWSNDLLLRQDPEREDKEIALTENLNLNTIRFEGQIPSRHILELADKNGLLVIAGLACCSFWEEWDKWSANEIQTAVLSLRDQAQYLKSHASVLAYLYASDETPPPKIESRYLKMFNSIHWPNPTLASAGKQKTLAGPTGVKMTGPYDYVPPLFWYTDTVGGGAFGFNTETSPGAAVPPVETLKTFLPSDHLWPVDDVWLEHAGGNVFHTLERFNKGLNLRYGESKSLDEYALKSQVFAYDNHRAMFEAYGRKKYVASTGVIQWMLNNPWSSLIWHLFDHELRAGGSYFGAKKGNEPLHIQYSYDDQTIVVVNHFTKGFDNLQADIHVYDFGLNEKFALEKAVSVSEDSVKTVATIPKIDGISGTYFLRLELKDSKSEIVSRNFYWLSTKKEVLDFTPTGMSWVFIPTTAEADLTLLNQLEPAQVSFTKEVTQNKKGVPLVKVSLTNNSSHLAFAVHIKAIQRSNGNEVLPSLWDDNYISLMPGESRSLNALLPAFTARSDELSVEVDGWNVIAK